MVFEPVRLNVETALEDRERLIVNLPFMTGEKLAPFIQALKKETDRLIQVDIERCRVYLPHRINSGHQF